jgi:NTE family protein
VKGEAAGRAAQDRLKGLALSPERYAAWEAKRTRPPEAFERPVTTTIVSGTERTNAIAILREVERRAGVVVGETASDEQLVAAARVVHGTGDYERVDVRTHLDEGRRIVTIDVDEKPWGPDYLRFGGRALSDFQTDARFTLTVQHTRTWMNSWGAEWRNELNLGDMRGLATSWYQPLGPGSPWFVEGLADTRKFNVDVFDSNFRRTDRLTNTVNGVIGAFGLRLGNSGVARLGGGYERYTVAPLIGTSENGTTKDRAKFWLGDVRFDTIDDPNFPRRGYVAELQTTRYYYDSLPGEPVQGYAFAYLQPITFDRLTLMGTVNAARSTSDRGGFSIGGFLQLSGTPANSLTGSEAYLLSALTYYRLPTLVPKAIGRNLYAGFSLEAGNSWRRRSDVDFSEWRKAGSVFLGLDSIIGPLYLGWGKTAGGDSSFYLFLGRPTDQVRMR